MRLRDWIVIHSPFWLQYHFMGRVVEVVLRQMREEGQVLLQEKEGRLRRWRQHRPSAFVRTTQLDLLGLPRAYQQAIAKAKLLRRYCRAHLAAVKGRYAHVGQRSTRTRNLQLSEG